MDAVRDLIPDLRAATEAVAIAKTCLAWTQGWQGWRMVPP